MDNTETTSVHPVKNSQLSWSQVLVTWTLSIGGLLIGIILSYSSPAIESLKDTNHTQLNLSDDELSWIVSIMPLSGVIGSIGGGQLVEYGGRKWTIFAVSIPCMIGWGLIASALNFTMILIGRCLTGIGLGMASVSFQVYLSESVHPDVRGSLGVFGTLASNAGIVVGYGLGMILTWYQLAYVGLAIVFPYAFMTLFILPETPRWYIKHNREDDARKSLSWLRAAGYNIESEIKDFIEAHNQDSAVKTNQFRELMMKWNLKPLLIVLGIVFSAQLSGVQCLIFYNVTIFKLDNGLHLSPHLSALLSAVGLTLATLVPVFLSDRLGRKVLLIISGMLISVLMFIMGAYFYIKSCDIDMTNFKWIPLVCMFSILVAYGCGYGPIPFLLMGELLPMPIRGLGASIVILGNFIGAFAMSKTFLDMLALIKIYGIFWTYSILTILTLIFIVVFVPETKRKSLEDIQRSLSPNTRRYGNSAEAKSA